MEILKKFAGELNGPESGTGVTDRNQAITICLRRFVIEKYVRLIAVSDRGQIEGVKVWHVKNNAICVLDKAEKGEK